MYEEASIKGKSAFMLPQNLQFYDNVSEDDDFISGNIIFCTGMYE